MKSAKYAVVASVLAMALALGVSACGGGGTTTVTDTQATPPQTTSPTSTTTPPTTSTTASTSTTATTTTAAGPGDCTADQAYSQVSHTCVNVRSGNNPCPPGEVPMADRPVCVAKDQG